MLVSQEKILGPKVNVKFFTVDPYTPCNRVSRPFPIWPIWQIWSLLGQKNMYVGGLRSKAKGEIKYGKFFGDRSNSSQRFWCTSMRICRSQSQHGMAQMCPLQ